jgi:hypothetical protein
MQKIANTGDAPAYLRLQPSSPGVAMNEEYVECVFCATDFLRNSLQTTGPSLEDNSRALWHLCRTGAIFCYDFADQPRNKDRIVVFVGRALHE